MRGVVWGSSALVCRGVRPGWGSRIVRRKTGSRSGVDGVWKGGEFEVALYERMYGIMVVCDMMVWYGVRSRGRVRDE